MRGLDRPYGVRLLAHYDAKSDATIFDAEIAGTRTMLTRREGRYTDFQVANSKQEGK